VGRLVAEDVVSENGKKKGGGGSFSRLKRVRRRGGKEHKWEGGTKTSSGLGERGNPIFWGGVWGVRKTVGDCGEGGGECGTHCKKERGKAIGSTGKDR